MLERDFMRYENIEKGIFINRPNRFIANVNVGGKEEVVHVKNTGRCKELLLDGTSVYLNRSDNEERKTKYDLVAVEKNTENGTLLINMDSQIPNDVAEEWLKRGELFSKNAKIQREVKYKNSRFDFYVEDGNRKAFLEVKGVTLERNGVAYFPDAPTERGIKHLTELIDAKENGYESYVLFIIQMDEIDLFKPNDETHKAFGDALRNAENKGVKILAYNSTVTPNSIEIKDPVLVDLKY